MVIRMGMSTDGALQRGRVSAELIEQLCRVRGEPVLSTDDVAQILSVGHDCAEQQLRRLAHHGEIERRSVPGGAYHWVE